MSRLRTMVMDDILGSEPYNIYLTITILVSMTIIIEVALIGCAAVMITII
jgi:hypothetical protein